MFNTLFIRKYQKATGPPKKTRVSLLPQYLSYFAQCEQSENFYPIFRSRELNCNLQTLDGVLSEQNSFDFSRDKVRSIIFVVTSVVSQEHSLKILADRIRFFSNLYFTVKGENRRFCPDMGKYESQKTRILAYFTK